MKIKNKYVQCEMWLHKQINKAIFQVSDEQIRIEMKKNIM